MKIWEALIYGLVAGLTGLLPVSFSGHAAVLQDAFALSPLTQGGGLYVRAAITLGLSAALVLAFPGELQLTCGRRDSSGRRAARPVAARPDAGCLPSARPADGFRPALYGDADARLFAV